MQESLLTVTKLEEFVPANHPLRPIRVLVNEMPGRLNNQCNAIYAETGRESIAPEKFQRALLLQVFYTYAQSAGLASSCPTTYCFAGERGVPPHVAENLECRGGGANLLHGHRGCSGATTAHSRLQIGRGKTHNVALRRTQRISQSGLDTGAAKCSGRAMELEAIKAAVRDRGFWCIVSQVPHHESKRHDVLPPMRSMSKTVLMIGHD